MPSSRRSSSPPPPASASFPRSICRSGGTELATFYDQQQSNRRLTFAFIAAFVALFAVVGVGLDVGIFGFLGGGVPVPLATAGSLALSTVLGAASYFRGSSMVLASLRAAALDPADEEHRQLHNIVTEMALAAGLPKPKVFVLRDPAPNAMATGRDPEHAAIAVTEGALALLDREETQGVVAHEMAHIGNRDTLTMTVVGVLLGGLVLLADWGRRSLYLARLDRRRGGLLILPLLLVLLVLSPILSRLLAMAISRQREYLADATAVQLTRNPLGLARALEKIAAHDASPLRAATRGTAHLFIADPLRRRSDEREGRLANLLSTHPPVHVRVALLRAMAQGAAPS